MLPHMTYNLCWSVEGRQTVEKKKLFYPRAQSPHNLRFTTMKAAISKKHTKQPDLLQKPEETFGFPFL